MDPNAARPAPPAPDANPPALAPPAEGAVVGQPAPVPRQPLDKSQTRFDLLFNLALIGAAIAGFGIVFGIAKWWARRQTDDCESPTMSLSSYREMYENGELSEEEYRQIRDKMAAKIKGGHGIRPSEGVRPTPVGREESPPAPENPT